jgi:hypothetical protein
LKIIQVVLNAKPPESFAAQGGKKIRGTVFRKIKGFPEKLEHQGKIGGLRIIEEERIQLGGRVYFPFSRAKLIKVKKRIFFLIAEYFFSVFQRVLIEIKHCIPDNIKKDTRLRNVIHPITSQPDLICISCSSEKYHEAEQISIVNGEYRNKMKIIHHIPVKRYNRYDFYANCPNI